MKEYSVQNRTFVNSRDESRRIVFYGNGRAKLCIDVCMDADYSESTSGGYKRIDVQSNLDPSCMEYMFDRDGYVNAPGDSNCVSEIKSSMMLNVDYESSSNRLYFDTERWKYLEEI